MVTVLLCQALLVACAAALGFFFGPDREDGRLFASVWLGYVTFALFFWGDVIYIALHFIQKWW